MQISTYPELPDTLKELKLLKSIWDFHSTIVSVFEEWRTLLWAKVDTDSLEDKTKRLMKQLRELGQENAVIKGWQVRWLPVNWL